MKRVMAALLVIVIAGGIGVWAFFATTGGVGGSKIEDWIGKVILKVLDAYLEPKIDFARLDYQAPFAVEIDDLRMTAEDETILSVEKLHLELAEIPKYGQPIQIKAIEMTKPQLRFIKPAEQPIVGWGDFVEDKAVEDPESVPKDRRISDILVLRHVHITDGQLVYEDRAAGETMTLPGISFELDTPPVSHDPGWYELVGSLQREPVFNMDIDARLNIDTGAMTFDKLALLAELKEDQYGSFPPAVQKLLREHEVRGHLDALLTGNLNPDAPAKSTASLNVVLNDASVSFGENVFPVDSLRLKTDTADGNAKIALSSKLLGGDFSMNGDLGLTEPRLFTWNWEAGGIQIEETLKATQQNPPKYAGQLNTKGRGGIEISRGQESLRGDGELHLTKGRLVNMPLVTELRGLLDLGNLNLDVGMSDKADVVFLIQPDRLRIRELKIAAGTVVVSGDGNLLYDGTLDLKVQAGAIERLTEKVPVFGQLFKDIGGKLLTFDVKGELGNPKVTARPLDLR